VFVQHQLMSDLAVDIGYVGSANRKQIGYHGWNNAVTPGPGPVGPRRLLAGAGFTGNMDGGSNHFNSEYNALQLKVTKQFSKGLAVLGNYTWGKCMDDQSSLAEGKFQDFLNARADWSRCSYDIKHAFKVGYVYDLPFGRGRMFGGGWNRFTDAILGGWAIEGIVQLQSGTPSNLRTGQDRANVGRTNERPDVLRNPNLDPGERTVDRWFEQALSFCRSRTPSAIRAPSRLKTMAAGSSTSRSPRSSFFGKAILSKYAESFSTSRTL